MVQGWDGDSAPRSHPGIQAPSLLMFRSLNPGMFPWYTQSQVTCYQHFLKPASPLTSSATGLVQTPINSTQTVPNCPVHWFQPHPSPRNYQSYLFLNVIFISFLLDHHLNPWWQRPKSNGGHRIFQYLATISCSIIPQSSIWAPSGSQLS